MDKRKIVIITGTGGILGTGHLQRMLNLASFMNDKNEFDISLLILEGDYPLPENFSRMKRDTLPEKADLIIRDMRDSSPEEIKSLEKIAPVLVVDDAGKGRGAAFKSIDLLPRPDEDSSELEIHTECFLYGYNFTRGIESLGRRVISSREIDIAIYAGFNPEPGLLSQISRSVPENTRAIILSAGGPVVLTGDPLPEKISYAEILAGSKTVMTHFGITMFEANICGCMIAALNPTRYHSELTETIRREMKLVHSAEYSSFDPVLMSDDIALALKKNPVQDISPDDILYRINSGLENFTHYIHKILL